MAVTTAPQGPQKDKTVAASPEPAEGLVLEADYDEDRPISLLAERQREFQKMMQGHYVDTEMPAA